jgi:predicted MFS family arabinose efflux permease
MWTTDTLWFDVAVVMTIFAVGSILFGRFEEHKPRWRRVLKVALVVTIVVALSTTIGRRWAYGILAVPLLGALWVHAYWLPKNGVNGWTAEPRDKYLALIGRKRHGSINQPVGSGR